MKVYSKILKKIGEKLTELELESEFIWNEDSKTQLKEVIKGISHKELLKNLDLYEQLQKGYDLFI